MKILYLCGGGIDYQSDCLFHGLRSVLGEDVIDYPERDLMYVDGPKPEGARFNLWNSLPRIKVDRDDLPTKILSGHFDTIVYAGKHFNDDLETPFDTEIKKAKNSRVVAIDGRDEQDVKPFWGDAVFKRESIGTTIPISFAVPKEKFHFGAVPRQSLWAQYEPGMPYIYTNEDDYNRMYQSAWFGVTRKKGGWDCFRHYEIMMNGCIPYFVDIEKLPKYTCHTLPVHWLRDIVWNYKPEEMSLNELERVAEFVYKWALGCCTTEALAKYFLGVVGK